MSETDTAAETGTDEGGSGGNPLMAMGTEMAAGPQPTYKLLRDEMPVLSMDIGSNPGVIISRKEDVDFALRHTEIFSSNIDAVDLKNKRPMIPLQIDPPEHKKFRKLLDPIFAPRKMAAMDEEVSELVNNLIDRFIDRRRIGLRQGVLRPLPVGGVLDPLGPAHGRARHVPHHEGRHHPARARHGDHSGLCRRPRPTSRRSPTRSTSTSTASSTSARRSPRTTCCRTS